MLLQQQQQYLFGGIIASLLGLFFVLSLLHEKKRKKKKNENASSIEFQSSSEKISGGGECRSDGSATDVIIVGAGVAGSALAYTLGKVIIVFYSALFHLQFWFWIGSFRIFELLIVLFFGGGFVGILVLRMVRSLLRMNVCLCSVCFF